MPIQNILNNVKLSNSASIYLNHPANAGMSDGYWFYYTSSIGNNTLGIQKIKPFRWGTELDTGEVGDLLTIEGTVQLVSESLNRNRVFHTSTITRNGEGLNPQTGYIVDDAFYFYHLGDIRANDNIGYWDYALTRDNTSIWEYFQYHQHQPRVYEDYYGGRNTFGSHEFINPSDRKFIYMHNVEVSAMGTKYSSILARVHTPSVGGAHNSHYDVELPTVITKNYIPGGVIAGSSNRFHCFYISANGSQWDVFSRTYALSLDNFTSEVNYGTYDLADPTNQTTIIPNGVQDKYPLRVSAGTTVGNIVYFPVIYNSVTGSTFDLKIWKFESNISISQNSIVVQTINTGYTQQPDCHLSSDGSKLTAAVSDIANGGVDYYTLSNDEWAYNSNIVTNGNQDIIRIHGYDYNTEDSKFYVLLSGDVTGSVGNYSGSGVYSFSDTELFLGYKHVTYVTGSYGLRIEQPTIGGYLRYENSNGSLTFSSGSEPQNILESERILIFGEASPEFYNKVETTLGANEYFYAGTKLKDNRQVFVGTIKYTNGDTTDGNFLIAIYSDDYTDVDFYTMKGDGDDLMNSITYNPDTNKIWISGYSKSYNTEKRDIFVHGFGRGYVDADKKLEWHDVTLDSYGNQYFVGYNNETSSSIVAKLDYNFEEVFVNNIFVSSEADTDADVAYGVAVDSNQYIYVVGSTDSISPRSACVVKLDTFGSIIWSKYYATAGDEYASSIATIRKGSVDYLVTSIVSGSSTTINVINTNGDIIEQNTIQNFIVNRVRKSDTETDGYFLLAGKTNTATKAKFAKGQILSSGEMIKWVQTYSSASIESEAYDIRNTGESTGVGGIGSLTGPSYHIVGRDGVNGFITKFIVDVSGETYVPSKIWSTNVTGSVFTSLTNDSVVSDSYNPALSASINTYVAGYSSVSPEGEGGIDGVVSSFDYMGNRLWTNTIGHTGDEKLLAIENDVTGKNLITAGWSESHSNGRRTFSFRCDKSGFGTGNYHLIGFVGMAMMYQSSSLSVSNNDSTILSEVPPTNLFIPFNAISASFGQVQTNYVLEYYDGGDVYDMFLCEIDVNDLAVYKNSLQSTNTTPNKINYIDSISKFYQFGAAGDGSADDGNFLGYDILIMSGSGDLLLAGQTSGDFGKYNLGLTGVYDYILTRFNPTTHEYEFYQNGSDLDEEIYNMTELNDGSGSIAFVGRTQGGLVGPSIGGYDIFLGIYNPITDEFNYYQTGSGLSDRGVNVHDIGNNNIAIIYESAASINDTVVNNGGLDVGIIKFNYSTKLWDTISYQIGTVEDETISEDGKPSVYLTDTERIAIVGRTVGNFADDGITYGSNDIFIALFDVIENTFKKYQIGSEGNDTPTHIFSIGGDRLVIGGFSDASFTEPNNGIIVTFDSTVGLLGKSN